MDYDELIYQFIIDDRLYRAFDTEYACTRPPMLWAEFINAKDLGVRCEHTQACFSYTIIDQKKWMLTRIRYGI